jgi:hypothetical protein
LRYILGALHNHYKTSIGMETAAVYLKSDKNLSLKIYDD